MRACGSADPTVVDPASAIDNARAAGLFPVLVPQDLREGWRPVYRYSRPSPLFHSDIPRIRYEYDVWRRRNREPARRPGLPTSTAGGQAIRRPKGPVP